MDPAVAGLLEGSAFLSAQVKVKMDEEYQTFTRELLEQIFPDALAPTPSVMLVRAQAPADSPEIESGLSFTAGEYMDARFLDAQQRVSRWPTTPGTTPRISRSSTSGPEREARSSGRRSR